MKADVFLECTGDNTGQITDEYLSAVISTKQFSLIRNAVLQSLSWCEVQLARTNKEIQI